MSRHLHIDPFSGIAGDMFLGALIDLGADPDAIRKALAPLPIDRPYRITTRRVSRSGIGAIDLQVEVDEPAHHHHHGHDHDHGHHHHPRKHHHTGYRQIMAMINQLDAADRARQRAAEVVTRLGRAEARVHDIDIDKVHFHEVGAVDSIVDMLGSCVALELLEIDSLSCGLVPMSRGWVKCEHGLMPVPAPATAYLLEGIPTQGVDREGEIVTPTGAAMIAGLCSQFGTQPAMTLRGVGYGAGDKQFPQVPNLLRVILGDTLDEQSLGPLTPQTFAIPQSCPE